MLWVTHNPHFWHAYFEIAPGDPGMGLLHAGLLLGCGEATGALHVIEFYQSRPGIPKAVGETLGILHNATRRALVRSPTRRTQAGIQLFDAADYVGAVKKYREALKIWPQNGWAYYELGYTLHTQDRLAAGEKTGPPQSVQIKVNDQVKVKFSAEVKEAFAN